jgi:hypothetical protein
VEQHEQAVRLTGRGAGQVGETVRGHVRGR